MVTADNGQWGQALRVCCPNGPSGLPFLSVVERLDTERFAQPAHRRGDVLSDGGEVQPLFPGDLPPKSNPSTFETIHLTAFSDKGFRVSFQPVDIAVSSCLLGCIPGTPVTLQGGRYGCFHSREAELVHQRSAQ